MNAFLVSLGAVALAEFGDKTQILALVLAARFRRPLLVLGGIAVAALANHGMAALAGTWLGAVLNAERLEWLVGLSFLAVALWALVPERDDDDERPRVAGYGAFVSTAFSMFLAEMGDRTQIATVILAARFETLVPVVLGTTLGMVLANVPAVFLGRLASERLPLRLIHGLTALVFAALGVWILLRAGARAL